MRNGPFDVHPQYFAKGATVEEFFEKYVPEIAVWTSGGSSALWGAVANRDPRARVVIANRLLDDGADATVSQENVNLLHILFEKFEHDFEGEALLLRRLLEGGADINLKSRKWGPPLLTLYENLELYDEVLGPFYDVIFSWPGIDGSVISSMSRNKNPRTLFEIVSHGSWGKPEMARRFTQYQDSGPSAWPVQ